MSRYNRINVDGKSITETRTTVGVVRPGEFVVINADDKFEKTEAAVGRMYVVNPAYHQGLSITEAIPEGDSAVGEYVEEGREIAVLCAPGSYKKDSPLKLAAGGMTIATDDTDTVIGYSQDEVDLAAIDFIRVRFRVGTVAAAAPAA